MADLFMVVHKAAPVEQVEHGLKAEHGLLRQLGITGNHEGPGLQLDRLVSLPPGKLLEPHLGQSYRAGQSQAIAPKQWVLWCVYTMVPCTDRPPVVCLHNGSRYRSPPCGVSTQWFHVLIAPLTCQKREQLG